MIVSLICYLVYVSMDSISIHPRRFSNNQDYVVAVQDCSTSADRGNCYSIGNQKVVSVDDQIECYIKTSNVTEDGINTSIGLVLETGERILIDVKQDAYG